MKTARKKQPLNVNGNNMPTPLIKYHTWKEFQKFFNRKLKRLKTKNDQLYLIKRTISDFERARKLKVYSTDEKRQFSFDNIIFHLQQKYKEIEMQPLESITPELKQIINHEKFKMPANPIAGDTQLTVTQTALLFSSLKKHQCILRYNNTKLAEILYFLTGHSANTVSKTIGKVEILFKQKDVQINKDAEIIITLLTSICNELKNKINK